ncbi:MAG: PKD domain-containing protein [Gemmatimonadetes bacterium]|nr:PKD domain-containing protein [Gemmatimonadota bacterium]
MADGEAPRVQAVVIQPADTTIAAGDSVQLLGVGLLETLDTAVVQLTWTATEGEIKPKGAGNALSVYTSPMTGSHRVVATDTSGLADTATVTVGDRPTAAFTFLANGNALTFADASTDLDGSVIEWSWDFGDGLYASPDQNPSHTYGADGSYDVTLTVTDDDGLIGSTTRTIVTTSEAPRIHAVVIQPADTTIAVDDSVQLHGVGLMETLDTTVVQLTWTTTDGEVTATGTGKSWAVYTNPNKGSHRVVATDTSGLADTATVTVGDRPIAAFTFLAAGNALTFTDASTDLDGSVLEWNWDFGDGSDASSEQNPSHTYGAYGSYDVTLTVTDDDGLIGSTTRTIVTTPQIHAVVIQPADTTIAVGDSVRLHGVGLLETLDTTVVQLTWTTMDGEVTATGTGNSWAVYKNPNKGSHRVVATDTSGLADTATVVVGDGPTAAFTFSSAGTVLTFTDASTDLDGSVVEWNWNFGDGSGASSEQHPSHTYGAEGSYDVTLTVTDDDGLTGSTTRTVATDVSPPLEVVTLAFIGDQGYEDPGQFEGPRAVLQLIEDEGADAVMHQGDFDYDDDPSAWIQMLDDVLGPDFPYFASVGNHDTDMWDVEGGYKELLEERASRLGFSWTGEYGEHAELHFRGIHMLFGAPGTLDEPDEFYADYFAQELAADTSTWRVCSWHKNQREMQVGGKKSTTGWGVYEECRAGGAIIATGHEHSYSRTHLLSSMENQTLASTSDTLTITEGETFAFVSGLGGKSIRAQELDGDWWASIYTSDQNATHGALFGIFNIDGRGDLAYFYFKDIDGNVVDSFWVISGVD